MPRHHEEETEMQAFYRCTEGIALTLQGFFRGDDTELDTEQLDVQQVETYAEAGIITRDSGLVVTLSNGAEFQVTIVRSKRAR